MRESDWVPPPGLDVSKPSIARAYDAVLGGKNNFPADREVARALFEAVPGGRQGAQEERAFLVRGVHYLAGEAGVDQFLDIGAGLPTMKNTHEAAREVNPGARVVYVDNDPIVLSHGRALLASDDNTTVITADLREPDAILNNPDTRRLIDFNRPVAILLLGILHHLADEDDPYGLVARLLDAIPSGSYLFIAAFADSGEPAQAELNRLLHEQMGRGAVRPFDELRAYFAGCELVDPGVVFLPLWRPESPINDDDLAPYQRLLAGGIGRKL